MREPTRSGSGLPTRYEPGLDGLRSVAIAGVIGFHYTPRIVTGGSLGVDIFFVLSGWLITSLLLREADATDRVDYRAFLVRRFLRLMPPLAALLVAYVLLAPVFIPRAAPTRWIDAGVAAAYLTNLRETFWPANNPLSHTWFLALQGQFYLGWPPILVRLRRLGRGRAAAVLLAAWLALTLARVAWYATIGGPGAYYFTPLHATGLLLGAAYALKPVRLRWGWAALGLLVLMLVFGHTRSWMFLALQPIVELATLVVVASPPRVLALAPLPFLGRISYGIYLWHVPFMWVFPARTWTVRVLLVLASIGAGWLSNALLERPLARVRAKPAPNPARPTP